MVHEHDGINLVAQSCRILGKLDLTHAALGHVSMRLDDTKTMLIKAKGPSESGLRFTQSQDIITVDFEGNKVSGADGFWAPGECFIHTWLYKKRPDVNCVIHVHPEHAVLLTICEKEIYPIYGAYWPAATQIAADGVNVFPSSLLINDNLVGEEFADFVGSNDVALMYGHGITVVGTSVYDASVRAIALNQLVTMMYKAYAIGTPKRLPDSEIKQITKPRDTAAQMGSATGEAGTLATWKYYAQLAGENV